MSEQSWPQEIGQAQFVRLTPFRLSGTAVSTPVWVVVDADALPVTLAHVISSARSRTARHPVGIRIVRTGATT